MKITENDTITYFLNNEPKPVPLQCRFLASGFYTVEKPERYHRPNPTFNRLFLLQRGGGLVSVGAESTRLVDGRIYLLPRNQTFDVAYAEGTTLLYFHFVLEDYFGHDVFESIRGLPPSIDRRDVCDSVMEGYRQRDRQGSVQWQTWLFVAIMEFASPLIDAVTLRSYRSMKYHDLLAFVRERCDASLRVEDIARRLGRPAAAMSTGFRREFGISLKRYLLNAILGRARELLVASDLQVREVAEALGYQDPYYFARVFRRYMGESPLQYRKRTRSAAAH